MNTLTTQVTQLPDNIADLSKFVLIGREKLVAVRAEIRAIDKVGLAQEVRKQKLQEAQDIADAVLDAEVRIGQLTTAMPKASGTRTDIEPCNTAATRLKPKEQQLSDIGLTRQQASRFETLAAHPEAVEQAKAEARENEDIVSRSAVLKKIKFTKEIEKINESGSDALKEQVKSGEKSITQAFNEVMAKENKKLPSAKEYRKMVEERHEEFKEQKVPTIADVRQDKADKALLGNAVARDIMKATEDIGKIYVLITAKEIDVSLLSGGNKEMVATALKNTKRKIDAILQLIEA